MPTGPMSEVIQFLRGTLLPEGAGLIATLPDGVRKAMLLTKLKVATSALLVAAAVVGSGRLVYRAQGAQPAVSQAAAARSVQDDVADVPSKDLRAGQDQKKRYFLIGPAKDAKAPKNGYGLVVILPGGDGSAEFHPFVKRIFKNALPEGYLAAQPVAVKWTDDQQIVWPTAKNKVEGMKFTTEEFIDAVIGDVAVWHKLDRSRVFTLTWSSSGPAAYAASLTSKNVTGSFIAMSVFKPNLLPSLAAARGRGYYLYHSPDDRICPYRMAEQAEKDLKKAGAKVKLVTYDGGHGWRGPLYDNIGAGIKWLEGHHGPAAKARDEK